MIEACLLLAAALLHLHLLGNGFISDRTLEDIRSHPFSNTLWNWTMHFKPILVGI